MTTRTTIEAICDRCENTVELRGAGAWPPRWSWVDVISCISGRVADDPTCPLLCPDCTKSLERWMEN